MFVWHKTNPAPKVYRNGFCNSCEFVIFLWNKGHVWNFSTQEEMHNFFECPICSYPERLKDPFHPAQKPLNLIDHFIEIASILEILFLTRLWELELQVCLQLKKEEDL